MTDAFLKAVENDEDWQLINRVGGGVAKTIKARELLGKGGPRGMGLRRSRQSSSTTP